MMRLRGLKPTNEKVVKLQMHPTLPWVAYADTNDNVVVWDWEHRQIIYEIKAGGVDERRLVGAQLQKIAEGEPEIQVKAAEAIKGGSVKQIKFYDDDVRFWQAWLNRAAAMESPVAASSQFPPIGPGPMILRGRHFLVICCIKKVIFQDLVSMRARDVPKSLLENKSPLCVEFLPRSMQGDGPLAAFGGSDGVIRVLSMSNWQLVRKYSGGHKSAVSCLTTFTSPSGETLLISGANDGLLIFWPADNVQATREVMPKHSLKAHDGAVTSIDIIRVQGSSPLLVTIGTDKTLAVWQTTSFKEHKRMKPVSRVPCHSVASWSHPRVPGINILTCVKDSHIWAIESVESFGAQTRALCELSSQLPASLQAPNKKLKGYCMAVHPLQPQYVAVGTSSGVFLSEFDASAVPAAAALPTPAGSKEHQVICAVNRDLRLLSFQLSQSPIGTGSSAIEAGRARTDSAVEASQFHVKQSRKTVGSIPHDLYAWTATSKSGKYVSVVWPDVPAYCVYGTKDWNVVDSGQGKYFAWDSCKERYALLEMLPGPKLPPVSKGSSKKAREAAAQAAAIAAAAAASAAASASVEVRILLDDGSSNLLAKSIEGRPEPVIGLQGGALLGVAYKMPRRSNLHSAAVAAAASAAQNTSLDDGFGGVRLSSSEDPPNFQLYSWETYQPVGGLLPQPLWSAWDQTVEYCALAYEQYVVICALRPAFRYLGNVAIQSATGGVWHRRQLFVATPTTIECVFVDAGVSVADIEFKKKKEELKALEAQAKAVAQHGELALITVEAPQAAVAPVEITALRPPMLQVVRLASFQTAPSVPPFLSMPKQQPKPDADVGPVTKELEERKVSEVAVAGGGISVANSRLPPEQKRPVGPLVVVGVRDGVLWLVDRHMTAHAIGLTHPGIRCRCLAAYGDAVSAVKWASRLGREHHDDLAQFMLGMGYAQEALHLPGLSKRLEYDLAIQSGDLKRALQCLIMLSHSKNLRLEQEVDSGFQALAKKLDVKVETANLAATSGPKPVLADMDVDALSGIAKFAEEYFQLIDAADATGQSDINSQALKRLASAGVMTDAFRAHEIRGLALRLATHGELSRLGVLANTLIAAGQGREAALAAAFLGDPNLVERALLETGMYAEAALHAHAHGRATLTTLLEVWSGSLDTAQQKGAPEPEEMASLTPSRKTPLSFGPVQPPRKPLVEIVPPGNVKPAASIASLTGPTLQQKSAINPAAANSQPGQLLAIEGPPLVPGYGSALPTAAAGLGPAASVSITPAPTPPGTLGPLVEASPPLSIPALAAPEAGAPFFPIAPPDPFAAFQPAALFAAFSDAPFTASSEPPGPPMKPAVV